MLEADLYDPIKTYLKGQGYEVKGEAGAVERVGGISRDSNWFPGDRCGLLIFL